jgi:REP element-mobilizing transposase RayT
VPRPTRKRLRLADPVYREQGRLFSLTIGTAPRPPVFLDIPFGQECIAHLREIREKTGTLVYAYCLMPDHVHLLLGAIRGESLPAVLGRWKSLCAKSRRDREGSGLFWQRSFYDRALRDEDNIINVALYILGNPVRAGLAADFHDYPLCGSMEFDL